jgi:hypothetical protein
MPAGCKTCGIPASQVCLCSQLSIPTAPHRARTVWVGSILPIHSSDYLSSILSGQTDDVDDVVEVTIKRNKFKSEDGGSLGFALCLFKTEALAQACVRLGSVQGLPIKPHQWLSSEGDSTIIPSGAATDDTEPHECELNGMPSLLAQLEPLTEKQLRARLILLNNPSDPILEQAAYTHSGRLGKKAFLKNKVASLYRSGEIVRKMIYLNGASIPDQLCDELLEELRGVHWGGLRKPVSRKGVEADNYIVIGQLSSDSKFTVEPRYQNVWDASQSILRGLKIFDGPEPHFKCTSIAVTKNFVGSPHTDAKDSTYQFATCLGDFNDCNPPEEGGGGGRLCVELEGNTGEAICVINTYRRLAKVDGRYPHWVSDYKGERFSVIYFCVDPTMRVEPTSAVYRSVVEPTSAVYRSVVGEDNSGV